MKIINFCTVPIGILQVLSKKYLKNNHELLESVDKEKYKFPKIFSPRVSALIKITGVKINLKLIEQVVINFLAKKELMAGAMTDTGIVGSKIPLNAVSTYLRDTFLQNLSDLDKMDVKMEQ